MAKVEWHPGDLYPRVGFSVTNLARSPEGIVAFYNQRGTCEQYTRAPLGANELLVQTGQGVRLQDPRDDTGDDHHRKKQESCWLIPQRG